MPRGNIDYLMSTLRYEFIHTSHTIQDSKPDKIICDHLIPTFSILAATEFKYGHKIGKYLHWNICQDYDLSHAKKMV